MPQTAYEPAIWKRCKLHRDCHVVFENSYYSAPHSLIGQTVDVAGSARQVRIYDEHRQIAVHSRKDKGERSTWHAHLPPEKGPG